MKRIYELKCFVKLTQGRLLCFRRDFLVTDSLPNMALLCVAVQCYTIIMDQSRTFTTCVLFLVICIKMV